VLFNIINPNLSGSKFMKEKMLRSKMKCTALFGPTSSAPSSSAKISAETTDMGTPLPSCEDLANREGPWNPLLPDWTNEDNIEDNIGEDPSWLEKPWVACSRLKLKERERDRVEFLSVVGDKAVIRDKIGSIRQADINNLFPVRPLVDEHAVAWTGEHEGKRFKVRVIEDGICEVRPFEMLGKKLGKNKSWPKIPTKNLIAAHPPLKK
jgi:hypothetical protein